MIDYIKQPELLKAVDSSEIGELLREILLKSFTNSKGQLTTVLGIWSRDCDQCEGTGVHEYHHRLDRIALDVFDQNVYKAALRYKLEGNWLDSSRVVLNRILERIDSAYYNAEGPVEHFIMSEMEFEEYKQHGHETRDRILEAYEEGNGNAVII